MRTFQDAPCGVMCSSFSALKSKQISAHRGEKVRILSVERGYAEVEKEDGKKGFVPTYFIDLDEIPGENFADQIRYRREWYRLMDNEENSNFGEPSSHFLDNIPFIVPLASFFPVRRPSTFPRYHKRPICTMSLEDISTKVKQNFVLCSQFFSDEPYDITWRGPAIAAKRDFVVTHDEESITRLTVYNCGVEDAGQYWVQAENKFGKCHSVAWVNVIAPPGRTHFSLVKPLSRDTLLLQWKAARSGNSRNLRYSILYKFKGLHDFEMAQGAIMGTSTMVTNLRPVKYEFRIYARNEYFIGKASEATEVDMQQATHRSMTPEGTSQSEFITREAFEKRYEYGELIAVGRFGNIRLVIDTVSGRQYVAKIYRKKTKYDWNEIEKQLKICSSIQHPNIVSTMAIVSTPEERIHIMQRVNGPPLLDYIIGLGYISEALVRRFCKDLLAALQYLHSMQIAHLGIVPENLLTHTSKSVRLILIDFETCRICESGTFVWNSGSIDFASPEQVAHKQITTNTDMWSFGIILHVLVSGRSPFENDSDEVLRLMIISSSSSSTFDEDEYHIYSPSLISLLKGLIIQNESERLSATECLESNWMRDECSEELLLVDYLEDYKERRQNRQRKFSL